jgi:ribosomal protein L7Ae-like RNA K-turn-binding protein
LNNIADKKILSMFGLAARAGKIASGEFQTETAVKSKTAYLVVVAEDASDNTKKLFHDKCSFYKVPVITLGTKEELGHAIGKEFRASIAILDEGFAGAVMKKIESLSQAQ